MLYIRTTRYTLHTIIPHDCNCIDRIPEYFKGERSGRFDFLIKGINLIKTADIVIIGVERDTKKCERFLHTSYSPNESSYIDHYSVLLISARPSSIISARAQSV